MNAATLAQLLGFKKSGRQYVGCCVAHADTDPSMIIFDGYKGVQVRCLSAGCAPEDIIAELKRRGLWERTGGAAIEHDHPAARAARAELRDRRAPVFHGKQENVSQETPTRTMALRLWDRSYNIHTAAMALDYLAGRGLALPSTLTCARFHPRCVRGDGEGPAIVVLMTAFTTRRPQAIQRIFLRRDGDRVVKDGTPMMLGQAGGAGMMLTSWFDTFHEELLYAPQLTVCEGFETGLALLARGQRAVWALGSAGAIGTFPVLFGVGELTIAADHDEAGLNAAAQCAARWSEAGIPCTVMHRAEVGKDYADA